MEFKEFKPLVHGYWPTEWQNQYLNLTVCDSKSFGEKNPALNLA